MIYKGYELLKAIADGEIKEGSKFIDTYGEYIYKREEASGENVLYRIDEVTEEYTSPDYSYFAEKGNDFELIEDEIDIDSIDELDKNGTFINGEINDQRVIDIQNKINQLVQAVKQLNKEVKELKK